MRAAVLLAERSVGMEEVPDARLPGPDGVVVTIEQAAICGSDLHLYHGDLGLERVQLGHEAVGLVAEVGADVHTLSVGDRVLISGVIACGHCTSCWRGDPVGCRNGQTAVLGTTPELPGGQAEAIGVPGADAFVTKVPDGIGVEDSVLLTDILPTGYLGALRADITPGDTVVVVGLGPVGIMALECAGLFGPARMLAVDVVPDRLARAARLGAEPIDARDGGAVAAVAEATAGRGAEAVIEAVGLDQTIIDAISMTAVNGTVSVIGVNLNMALPFPMGFAFLRSITVRSTIAAIPGTWGALIPLLQSGRLRPEGTFTHHLGLSEVGDAYAIFDERRDGVLKVLLDPRR